jgi:hypothetical protein
VVSFNIIREVIIMVWDRYTREHHLTPDGWIIGSFSVLSGKKNEVEPPEDRVETWEENMTQQTGFSKEYITWKRIWKSPFYSEKQLQELHKKFPKDLRDQKK